MTIRSLILPLAISGICLLSLSACKEQQSSETTQAQEELQATAPVEQEPPHTFTGIQPEDIMTNQAIASAKDWAASFAQFYNPIMSCVTEAAPVTKVLNVLQPLESNQIMVILEQQDGIVQECLTHITDAATRPQLQPGQAPPPTTTVFYPAPVEKEDYESAVKNLPKPDSCLNNVAVQTRSGQKLGWLSFQLCAP